MFLKAVIIFLCVVAAALAETYTDKYDYINVKEVLANKRLFLAYVNCVLEKGKCSPEGIELKGHIKEAVETGCEKCTDAQKDGTNIIISHLINNEPEIWDELSNKFDPSGNWRKVYEERAKANGIVIPN